MAIKVPNEGEIELLDYLKATFNGANVKVRLYRNDYTPVDASVLADFTEANFSGYAEQASGGYSFPLTVGGKAQTTGTPKEFTHNGGATANDIYGFYVVNNAGTKVLWAERIASAPVAMSANGHKLIVTPQLTLSTES